MGKSKLCHSFSKPFFQELCTGSKIKEQKASLWRFCVNGTDKAGVEEATGSQESKSPATLPGLAP